MVLSMNMPQDRWLTASRCFQGILIVVLLQPVLFKSVRQAVMNGFSLDDKHIKISSQMSEHSGIDSIVHPKNMTISPMKLISDSIKAVQQGGHVRATGGVNIVSSVRETIRHVLPNVIPRTEDYSRDEITLLTHLSVSRLSQLKLQLECWHGPVSAAVVVTCNDDMNALLNFVRENQDLMSLTSIHVLVERDLGDNSYPYNVLRNLALHEAESDYVLAVDVDFVTEGYARLLDLIRSNERVSQALHAKHLLVLPAFENSLQGAKAQAIPESKEDVIEMVEDGLVVPFEFSWWPKGHGPTNFTKYYENQTDVIYDIDYKWDFEPYVLAYRHGLPRYWNDFRSYYFNKCSYFLEAYFMGFKFAVLRDFFVFHMGKSSRPPGNSIPPASEVEKNWKFHEYLSLSYGVPLSGKVVRLIPYEEVLK